MSDKIATSDSTQRDLIGTNPFVSGTYASDNPTAEESLLDLGLGSQTTSNPPAAIEATSELLIPGFYFRLCFCFFLRVRSLLRGCVIFSFHPFSYSFPILSPIDSSRI